MPVIASQILYFIESNTCSATIFGIVGAGAIGLYVNESIRTQDRDKTSFIIILILIAVAMIDFLSARIRRLILGSRAASV